MAKKPHCNPAGETCVRVWRGDRYTADKTPIGDLENLQSRFKDRLTICRELGGSLMIYPDSPGDHTSFHAFMAQHTPFTSQVIGQKHL